MLGWNMSETISGILTIRILMENKASTMGYVDYVDDSSVQKWDLIKDREYIIPGYQREIRWKRQNVQTLLDDVLNNSKFLGNILLSTAKKSLYEIMDGQQRITVIRMILERLKKYLDVIPLCKLQNNTFPNFAKELEVDFQIDKIEDPGVRDLYIKQDVLNQREKLSDLWMCVCTYIDGLSQDTRSNLMENLLDSEINLLITKVDPRKNSSRRLCVDYFIDINNKSESLDYIDILKAYAFRERFDKATTDWIKIQAQEKAMIEFYYPKEAMFLHYILCRVNKGLGYKVKKISDDLRLLSEVTLPTGKKYLKGTDIEVLITDTSFYQNMLSCLIAFQEFISVTLKSKTHPDEAFLAYINVNPNGNKLDFDTKSNIFFIVNSIVRSSDIVPRLLLMKYYLDVICDLSSTKDDYKLIYDINFLATCFSAGNPNSKSRASYSSIVMKEKWKDALKRLATRVKNQFHKKIQYDREVQYKGKATTTSGEYLAKRVAAIAYSYERSGTSLKFDEKKFNRFCSSVDHNAEHFLINQSFFATANYRGRTIKYEYDTELKGWISYLSNYLIIDENVNEQLGNAYIGDKIRIINEYSKSHPDVCVLVDPISKRNYEMAKASFIAYPLPEALDACDSVESAQELLANYYEGDFKKEFREYLQKIQAYSDDIFSLIGDCS